MAIPLVDLGYAIVGASEHEMWVPFTDVEFARFNRLSDHLNDMVCLNPYDMTPAALEQYGNKGLGLLLRTLKRYEPDLTPESLVADGKRVIAPFEKSMFESPEEMAKSLCEEVFLRMGADPRDLEHLLLITSATVLSRMDAAEATRAAQRQSS